MSKNIENVKNHNNNFIEKKQKYPKLSKKTIYCDKI